MADESARKSPNIGLEYSSPSMNRLALEVASEATETSFGVAVGDESESETRRTPEKLKSRNDLVE